MAVRRTRLRRPASARLRLEFSVWILDLLSTVSFPIVSEGERRPLRSGRSKRCLAQVFKPYPHQKQRRARALHISYGRHSF
jgi:hypothetical protein